MNIGAELTRFGDRRFYEVCIISVLVPRLSMNWDILKYLKLRSIVSSFHCGTIIIVGTLVSILIEL